MKRRHPEIQCGTREATASGIARSPSARSPLALYVLAALRAWVPELGPWRVDDAPESHLSLVLSCPSFGVVVKLREQMSGRIVVEDPSGACPEEVAACLKIVLDRTDFVAKQWDWFDVRKRAASASKVA